jgi:hypothetical protein
MNGRFAQGEKSCPGIKKRKLLKKEKRYKTTFGTSLALLNMFHCQSWKTPSRKNSTLTTTGLFKRKLS